MKQKYLTRKILLSLSILLYVSSAIGAQSIRKITGVVTDNADLPLEHITITLRENNQKAVTDKHGKFELNVSHHRQCTLQATSLYTLPYTLTIPAGTEPYNIQISLTEKTFGLPEVDITAYKSSSPLVDVAYSATRMGIPMIELPASIDVVTKKKLEEQQAVSFTDAIRNISGISTASPGEANNVSEVFVSRGFSMTNSRNYFKDGMRYRKVTNTPIAAIERIEFLRGPASVLYGSVEPGGIANIITKPTLYIPRYSTTLRVGSYNFKQASIDLTGPLNKNKSIRYRLNALYENSGSFRKHVDYTKININPKVDFDLGPATTLSLTADIFSDDRVVDPGVVHKKGEVIPNGYKIFIGEPWAKAKFKTLDAGYALKHSFNDRWKLNSQFRYTILSEDRLYFQIKDIQANNTINRRLAHWDAHISYYTFQNDIVGDFKTGSISHKLLIGMEYEKSRNRREVDGENFSPIDLANPVYTSKPENIASFKKSTDLLIKQDNLAFYIQDFISLNKQFKLLLGSRADWISDKNENYIKNTATNEKPFALSPRIAFTYNPWTSTGFYMSYTTSYVPVSGQTKEGKAFEPIRSKQWEIGAKNVFWGNRIMATLSLFHLRRTNVLTPDLEDPKFKIQLGEQYSKGIEFAMHGQVTGNLNIDLNYAYTLGEVSKSNDKKIPVGSQLSNVPKHNINIWGSYHLHRGALQGLSFGGGYLFSGKRYGNATNSIVLNKFSTADMFVSYSRRIYKLSLNVKNIFDKHYFLGAQADNLFTPAPLRTIMLSTTITL